MMTLDPFLGYQKKWAQDEAPVKIWLKSRRIGATWAEAALCVTEAAKSKEAGGQSTYYISYNQDMTQQFIKYCAYWAKVFNSITSGIDELVIRDEDKDILVYRIRFASDFEIWALPSLARSLRSKQGRIVIDEAAFVDDLNALLKAAMAMLMWGGCVRILSTHNGEENPFNDLIKEVEAGKKNYSLHRTTIDDALADGLYQRICQVKKQPWTAELEAEWKKALLEEFGDFADEELFCIPIRTGTRYFPAALLEAASDPSVRIVRKTCEDSFTFETKEKRRKEFATWLRHELRDLLKTRKNPVYLGEDFARSGDLTCIFLDELFPNENMQTFCVIELRNVPFDQQWQTIRYVMETIPHFAGGAFDSRGNGQSIAEYAAQEWPGMIRQVMITDLWYGENFPKLKTRLEDRTTNIPDDIFIREDFRAVGIKAGTPRVLARSGSPRERRHGDGAIAKLMATYAAISDEDKGYHEYKYESVKMENRYTGLNRGRDTEYA